MANDATAYSINVTIDKTTLDDLQGGGFSLYGFKTVATSRKDGAPLVWFRIGADDLLKDISIDWTEQYQGYIANAMQFTDGGKVSVSDEIDVALGQTVQVQKDHTLTVSTAGTADAISLNNLSDRQFTCGISQMHEGVAKQLCAFPLYGGNSKDIIAPKEKVVLLFATETLDTATVFHQAESAAVMIDLTDAPVDADSGALTRAVTFEMNSNWNAAGATWATMLNPQTNLVPFLIEAAAKDVARVNAA